MVESKSSKPEANKENADPAKEMEVDEEEEEDETAPSKVFTIEILRVIKDLQLQHGLRHGDYQRYRGYCSRRVKRLRKTLNLPQGDKRHFKKRDVTLANLERENSDERFIHIPLMLAERAWAYAMQLRQESNTEPRKRFHLVGKMRKATVYALQLQELCNSEYCDARTKLEAEAYSAWIHGSLHFELSLWKQAAENLKKAQMIYENLAQALPEEEQAVYKAKVDELTPSLRYCAYNVGEKGAINLLEMRGQGMMDNLSALVAQTKTESMEAFQTTEWRGRKVTVRPEKVRLFLLSIQDLANSIEKAKDYPAKIELLENVLLDCKDAISAIKDEIKQDPKLRSSSDSGTMTATQYLLTYLSYTRLKLTLERNLFMVAQGKLSLDDPNAPEKVQIEGKKTKPQDLSRLYEIILQNVTEMQQLPGMESDAQYQAEIENLALSFKSFRCYYIAITLVALKRWRDAVAMYERSTKYASQATASKKSVCADFDLQDELKRLIQTIEGCKFSAHANSVLEEDTTEESVLYGKSTKSSKPLFERLSVYKEDSSLNSRNPNVFKLTPEMQPIPAKPLFFDLALNFVEFPSLDDKVEQKGGAKQTAGMSGFVKGLFGWGGSGGK
ncbi:signal recognition particle subunit SRP68 [Culex quinquefasciatus]|uniref:signal recognition particle subunit SRP68 n=1 Tax=Culex quinquefasciatus TaxID=7176 RepID=UPI0018E390F8|nr:signal recognition particle subunit SRP68 [Culex quinquefasciatus]XP_039431428.1 signal recognition particle subunit SRP68 [Culex pipiens pallens]